MELFLHKTSSVFKSGLSKFFEGCLPQNLLSPFLNTFSQFYDMVLDTTLKILTLSLSNITVESYFLLNLNVSLRIGVSS